VGSLVQQLVRLREDSGTPQGTPERVDPVKDLGLQDPVLQRMYQRQGEVEERISRSSCFGCVKLEEHSRDGAPAAPARGASEGAPSDDFGLGFDAAA